MNKENTEPGARMSRCVGESRVHCLTENRKGNGGGRKVFPSSPSPLSSFHFLTPRAVSLVKSCVQSSVLPERQPNLGGLDGVGE